MHFYAFVYFFYFIFVYYTKMFSIPFDKRLKLEISKKNCIKLILWLQYGEE